MNNELLLKSEIEPGGRLRLFARDSFGALIQISGEDNTLSAAKFNWSITVGIEATFEIVTKHFSDTYAVSTTNGSVRVVGTQVKYTPADVGAGGFVLNGTMNELTVIKNAPVRPSVLSPVVGGVSVSVYPVLSSSAYIVDDTALVHTASRWQLSSDPEFINIIMDVESSTSLTAIKSVELERGRTYYTRVMHIATKP